MNLPHRSGTYRAVESLDGTWSCAVDPANAGVAERWYAAPRDDAHPAPVPGTIQQVFPGYSGVAWYWCQFIPARNPHPNGRHLVRFDSVDFRAEVWVNAERISTHDGAQSPFVLDITDSVRPGERNILCVRVLSPTDQAIDGLTLSQIPHRNKSTVSTIGSSLNHGGIIGSVELLCRPAVYISELIAKPNPQTGILNVLTLVLNTTESPVPANLKFSVAAAIGGETLQSGNTGRTLQPGQTLFETQVPLSAARLWEPEDPFLYRLTARVLPDAGGRGDEISTRFAFRDFRFEGNHFRLNGRRFFWKCARTLNNYPVSQAVPLSPTLLRTELQWIKAMGFNAVRFMAGLALPAQLDLCDELGLLVYEENYAAWNMQPSASMEDYFDRTLRQMILRDRNHPSVVIWGLLTGTLDGPVFKHAVHAVPQAAFLDDTRMIALNSGRADGNESLNSLSHHGSAEWNQLPMSGDVHLVTGLPLTREDSDRIRSLGEVAEHPVFISDWRISAIVDLTQARRLFEQSGRNDADDARLLDTSLEHFLRDWEGWQMARTFGRPEEFFAQAVAAADQRRLEVLTAIRANPRLIGLTVGLADDSSTGAGVLTLFREPRGCAATDIRNHLAPLRWCLFAEPTFVSAGGSVHIDAILANEEILPAGIYPVLIQIFDSTNAVVFERRTIVEITAAAPAAIPVLSIDVPLEGTPGRYRLAAGFEQGAMATAGELDFIVADAPELISEELRVCLWGRNEELAQWLSHRGIDHAVARNAQPGAPGEIVLVVAQPTDGQAAAEFDALTRRADHGSTIVFLTCDFFHGRDSTSWLPIGELATIATLGSSGDSLDAWAISHPIFAGLSGAGLLPDAAFRNLLPRCGFVDLDAAGQIVSAAHLCRMHPDAYRSGVLLSIHEQGAGRIVLSAFHLLENLLTDAAADCLLLNLIRYAGGAVASGM
jgi:hypothetical protein